MSKRQSIILRVMVKIWEQTEVAIRFGRMEDAKFMAQLFGRLQVMHQVRTEDNLLDLVDGVRS